VSDDGRQTTDDGLKLVTEDSHGADTARGESTDAKHRLLRRNGAPRDSEPAKVRPKRVEGNRKPGLPRLPFISDRIGRSSSATVDGLTPDAALHARRNFRLGVLNGVMFTLVEALIAPSLVLAWYVNRLGAPNVVVGLLPAILAGGWFLPQLLVASRVQGLSRVMHWYRRVGVIRTLCMAMLGVTTLLFAESPVWLLVTFFIFYCTYAFSAGVSGIPWLEIVGKVIAPRRRGTFFGLRNFWGGMLALAASAPIGAILSESLFGLRFPYNFAFLFGFTAVCSAVGVWAWASIHEPEVSTAQAPHSVRDLVKRGIGAVRSDRDYRAFMLVRILMALATVADPFYVVYATTRLGAPPGLVGVYLGALSIAALLSNFLWSPLADRASNRILLMGTVVSVVVVPLTALVISLLIGVADHTILFAAFTLVFILSGLALGGSRIVNNNMLLTIAPAAERPTYIGFLNTVLGIVIFVPVLGGVLVDLLGFTPIFLLSLGLALIAVLLATQMSGKPGS
jgi:MFS family permease